MQRMERGKSRSDLAWRPAGLANQFLYVSRRESSVGQVLGQMSRLILDSIPALSEVGRQDRDVNVIHVILPDTQIKPCTPDCAGHTRGPGAGIQGSYKEPGLQAHSRRWR